MSEDKETLSETHERVEELAKAMFKTDWPRDDWSRFCPKAHATERYRAMARVAIEMLVSSEACND